MEQLHFITKLLDIKDSNIKIVDMFSPYYDLAKQLRFRISRLRLKQSPRLFYSNI